MEKSERVVAALSERLEAHDNSRRTVQESLHNACNELRKFIDEMEEGVNRRLEEEFTKEDNRLQSTLNELRECIRAEEEGEGGDRNVEHLSDIIQKAVTELLVIQSYELVECEAKEGEGGVSKMFDLKVNRELMSKWVCLKKPSIQNITNVDFEKAWLEIANFLPQDTSAKNRVLSDLLTYKAITYKEGTDKNGNEFVLTREENDGKDVFTLFSETLESEMTYKVKVRVECNDDKSEWSDAFEFRTPDFSVCSWRECLSYVNERMKYFVDNANPMIASKTHFGDNCTIVGNAHLPLNKVTSWSVKILKSKSNDGNGILVGVAPSYIDQNDKDNANSCGWYLDCFESSLRSGPPQNYDYKEYGPRKKFGRYLRTGDSVGIVLDTLKGELSFVLNGVNLGVAYEGIPLDEPLVPCVLLEFKDDSVKLVT